MRTVAAMVLSDDSSAVDAAGAHIHKSRDPLGAVRRPPDPFALGDICTDAVRPSEASYQLARSLAVQVDGVDLLEEHLCSLAVAPEQDMLSFQHARGTIFFAETFVAAATCVQAGFRRGAPLDRNARARYEEFDADRGRVFGVFDPGMNALIFTSQAIPANHERVTLHELGHALTLPAMYRSAHLHPELLEDIPAQIADMLCAYPQGSGRAAVRERVLEVLAEAYVWTVVGRWRELPSGLFCALQGILTADC